MNDTLLQIDFDEKANKYIGTFQAFYPNRNIRDKSYDITIVRSLIMYFLYQEKKINKNQSINYTKISALFELKTHSTVLKAIEKIDIYLEDEKRIGNGVVEKALFSHFYFRFQKIFTKYQIAC